MIYVYSALISAGVTVTILLALVAAAVRVGPRLMQQALRKSMTPSTSTKGIAGKGGSDSAAISYVTRKPA